MTTRNVRSSACLLAAVSLLLGALAVLVAPAVAQQEDDVTLTGEVTTYAGLYADGAGGVHVYSLRTRTGSYRLEPAEHDLPTEGTVSVTGTLEGRTLTLARDARTVALPATRLATARAKRSTNVLVIRAYWKGKAPANPSTAQIKDAYLTRSDAYFREVSAGAYSVKGTVTPWLKIRKPRCFSPDGRAMNAAIAKAKSKGFNPKKFGRFMLYLPCGSGFIAGFASMPGKHVWMFSNTDLSVSVHEQGHNLGLDHANLRRCKKSGAVTVFSGNCTVEEYGDPFDAMGNQSTGHFSAANKARLGWTQTRTVTSTSTTTLKPFAPGTGLTGLRVKASSKVSYWLEYRTPSGFDADFVDRAYGVQVRRVVGRATELVDAAPESGDGFEEGEFLDEEDRAALAVGSSITTPEGIRIETLSANAGGADVRVTFGAGAAKAPAAPVVTAEPGESSATVTWTKPDDRGSPITEYVVSSDRGPSKTVKARTGLQTTLNGLTAGQQHIISVRAVNEAGTSAAGTDTVLPFTLRPTAAITSPADNATIVGDVAVTASATPNPTTGSPIAEVALLVDGDEYDSDTTAPYTLTYSPFEHGPVELSVRATDQAGRSGTSSVVRVTTQEPAFAITAPAATTTLTGPHTISYSFAALPGWNVEDVTAYLDGHYLAYDSNPDGTIDIDVRSSGLNSGTYELELQGFDPARGTAYARRTYQVSVPARSVTIISPAAGSSHNRNVDVTYTASSGWPWESVHLEDGTGSYIVGESSLDGALRFHSGYFDNGSRSIRVVLVDQWGNETRSDLRSITVANPTLSVAFGAGQPSTVTGTANIPYTLAPAYGDSATQWPWSFVTLTDVAADTQVAFASFGEPLQWFTDDGSTLSGTRTYRLDAFDDFGRRREATRTFTVTK